MRHGSRSVRTRSPALPTAMSRVALQRLRSIRRMRQGNTVYLGTTGGGVWKSTNAAGPAASVTFVPLTDTLPVFSANAGTSADSVAQHRGDQCPVWRCAGGYWRSERRIRLLLWQRAAAIGGWRPHLDADSEFARWCGAATIRSAGLALPGLPGAARQRVRWLRLSRRRPRAFWSTLRTRPTA